MPTSVSAPRESSPFGPRCHPTRYDTHARRAAFYDDVLERVTRLPGVLGAGYTTSVPLAWKGATTGFVIEGRPAEPDVKYEANHRQVSTDYLKVMGVPLVEGRYFTESDQATAQPVVIVNEAMARQYWPDGRAIGKRIKATDDRPATVPWLTVVGVVRDVRQMGLDAPVRPEMYVPLSSVRCATMVHPERSRRPSHRRSDTTRERDHS